MADLAFFKEAFDRNATDGVLGDPLGIQGYAYLRVSSSAQAEEGRSGLPRQIARIHEAAANAGIYIPWELVYADDHTGFEFQGRPELSRLRAEYTRPNRRANTVVIEYLDRLSRNADWHQGFLLDEMKQNHIETLFWKGFTSRVERAVMGAVSQDGMERSLEIMQEGRLEKARSGRVTARFPALGYMFVDAEGKPSTKTKKETYYAPHPEQAEIVRLIFYKVGVEGVGTVAICQYLEKRFSPPRKYKHWEPQMIRAVIRNPLYKGEFYANRRQKVLVPAKCQRAGEPVRMVKRQIERPREEWILVPVPLLVSEELWDAANVMLDQHRKMSPRNGKNSYLLTGLLRCAECGSAYNGRTHNQRSLANPDKILSYHGYSCNSHRNRPYFERKAINCSQRQIKAATVEDAIWQVICTMVMQPECLIAQIEAQIDDDENVGIRKQIDFLGRQLDESQQEDEKLYRAFMADVFDEQEYAAKRRTLKDRIVTLEKEKEALTSRLISREVVEEDKALILKFAAHAREMGVMKDASFAFRKRVLKLLVDKIILNVIEGWFQMEGYISGVWTIDEPSDDNTNPPPAPSGGIPPSNGTIGNGSSHETPSNSPAVIGNDFNGEHAMQCKGGAFYDCLTRVPLIVSWPSHIEAAQVDASMVNLIDVLPTLLTLQGITVPRAMHGKPLPTVTDSQPRGATFSEYGAGGPPFRMGDLAQMPKPWGRRTLIDTLRWREAEGRRKMVRTPHWKYVHDSMGDLDELYDMINDPWELTNIASDPANQGVIAEMRLRLADWMIETEDAVPVPLP
ncbi:MAG: recombinase family protein [Chloroflexota bacterium]